MRTGRAVWSEVTALCSVTRAEQIGGRDVVAHGHSPVHHGGSNPFDVAGL